MLQDILKKYRELPKEIRNKVSSSEKMKKLDAIEKEYSVSLANYIIRIVVNDIEKEKLANVLVEEKNIDLEKAQKISKELFNEIYGDVYDELQELYKNRNVETRHGASKISKTSAQSVSEPIDLMQKYNNFINSSLFQNILASQEQIKEKYGSGDVNNVDLKNDFYGAINAGDKIKVAGILRMACEKGNLGKFFKDDERYVDFFGGVLERHQGAGVKGEFAKDPANKKYLIEFLKFVLEKRLNFSADEAVMLGMSLASLCRQGGEKEYEDIAYGDEGKNIFIWS